MSNPLLELIERHVGTLRSEGISLIEALQNGDFEQARSLAHTIRGASGSLGFREYMEFAQNFEDYARIAAEEKKPPIQPESLSAFRAFVHNLSASDSEIYREMRK